MIYSRPKAGPVSKLEKCSSDNNPKPFYHFPLGFNLLSMFDQLLGGVKCHLDELIGREEEEEIVQARKSLPLLTSRGKLAANVSPQEPLE